MRYRANAPQVMAETIGGETIIVNLATGHYFNLQGSGVEIWEGIAQGESVPAVVARLEALYDAPAGEIEASATQLVDDLLDEELIVAGDANGSAEPVTPAPQPGRARRPFARPSLAKFTDMQDIILLDPVHEVDTRGWPHAPASA
jgi:Coenzyme PQQ synthesis protein D (PqqD)